MRRRERSDQPPTARLATVAVRYATYGWPVLPLHTPTVGGCSCPTAGCGSPGKHPRTRHGLHDATVDPDQVRAWWARWPEANIGVATGARSGLLVLDIDLPDGPASLHRLETDRGPLPDTCRQTTGSGGHQLLFAHPNTTVANRTGLLPGIDVRGDGGYIVVPPSRHATGARYRWTDRLPAAPAPGWLLDLVAERDRTSSPPARTPPDALELAAGTGRHARYATAALNDEAARVATAAVGTRNDTLNRAAFNLGQLVGSGLLDRDQVVAALTRAAADAGLAPAETRRTVTSGLAAGTQTPRRPPAPAAPATSLATPVRRRAIRRD